MNKGIGALPVILIVAAAGLCLLATGVVQNPLSTAGGNGGDTTPTEVKDAT